MVEWHHRLYGREFRWDGGTRRCSSEHISVLSSLLRRGREEGGKSRVVTWRHSKIVLEGKKKRVLGEIAFFFFTGRRAGWGVEWEGVKLQTGSPSRSLQLTQAVTPPQWPCGCWVLLMREPGTCPALTSGAEQKGPSGPLTQAL